MEASANELRELADVLSRFPGIQASAWTPGPQWCLTFKATRANEHELRVLVAVLGLLLVSDIQTQRIMDENAPVSSYTIGSGYHAAFKQNLAALHKNLWRIGPRG